MRMAVAFYVTGISTPQVHLESPPLLGTLTAGGHRVRIEGRTKAEVARDYGVSRQ